MFAWVNSRLRKEEGFTLVELMVVVLIIAILIAIAIPTFLGARTRAQDRAAQSDLRNTLTAAKAFYVDNENYGSGLADDDAYATALDALEPSLVLDAVADVAAADTSTVGVLRGATTTLFVRQSASTTWFCITDTSTGGSAGTDTGQGANKAAVDTVAECNATAAW